MQRGGFDVIIGNPPYVEYEQARETYGAREYSTLPTGNLYALAWLLARVRPGPPEQASTFARFALLVQGKGWLGTRCLDITKVAAVIDAPPKVANC